MALAYEIAKQTGSELCSIVPDPSGHIVCRYANANGSHTVECLSGCGVIADGAMLGHAMSLQAAHSLITERR